jgi:hypothetical protein
MAGTAATTSRVNGSDTTSSSSSSSSSVPSPAPTTNSKQQQWVHILRHGERRDFIEAHTPEADWHRYDPPLSPYGHFQATEAGTWINDAITNSHFTIDRVICSPFIRTVTTITFLVPCWQLIYPKLWHTTIMRIGRNGVECSESCTRFRFSNRTN